MFTTLEDEIVRILRANLSPALVPATRITNGPEDPPAAGEPPQIAFTADAFEVLPPSDDVSRPTGVKSAVEDIFTPIGDEPIELSRPPLEPLRAVEVEETPGGDHVLLRPRDDYTVNYLQGNLRFRRLPAGTVHIHYFTLQPLVVLSATRLRVDSRLEVWADAPSTIATVAAGAITANAAVIDGLVSVGEEIPDSGLTALGVRRVFFLFEALRPIAGRQEDGNNWRIDYAADVTMILTPRDEAIGLMRFIATTVTWDEQLAARVLSHPPPILDQPVTAIAGVGEATATTLGNSGVTTVGQLAQLQPSGQAAAIVSAIPRARIVRDRAKEVATQIVQAGPKIPDVAVFLDQPLTDLGVADLVTVGISASTADAIVDGLIILLDQITSPNLKLADLFFI